MRRLFKDLSNLKISPDWLTIKYDLQFTYDIVTSLLLFFLIFLFYKQSLKKDTKLDNDDAELEKLKSFDFISSVEENRVYQLI
jgi:hypothetical protein